MYKVFFLMGYLLLLSTGLFAQCEKCKMIDDDKSDFCFTSDQFEGYCIQFGAKSDVFRFRGTKGKIKSLPMGQLDDYDYLKSIANNRKLKLSNWEFLFILEGLKVWDVEQRKYGHEYEESGLGIKVVTAGDGPVPSKGEEIKVHYSGYLEDGTKFDSSYDRNEPISFAVGTGRVIKGWDEALLKLKKGSVAWLRIPPDLGYGSRGAGRAIPPNSTLIFKIELLK